MLRGEGSKKPKRKVFPKRGRSLFNDVECCCEVEENEGRRENARFASAVSHLLNKGKVETGFCRRLAEERSREVRGQIQADEGPKGAYFLRKMHILVPTCVLIEMSICVQMAAEIKHLHSAMQPTSIRIEWGVKSLFNERLPGFLETK